MNNFPTLNKDYRMLQNYLDGELTKEKSRTIYYAWLNKSTKKNSRQSNHASTTSKTIFPSLLTSKDDYKKYPRVSRNYYSADFDFRMRLGFVLGV